MQKKVVLLNKCTRLWLLPMACLQLAFATPALPKLIDLFCPKKDFSVCTSIYLTTHVKKIPSNIT